MNSKIELKKDIIKMTTSIWKNYPELAKYITEMPVHIFENESVNMKNLQDYYNSLEKLNSEYSKTHKMAKDQNDSEKYFYSDLHLYLKSEDIYEQLKEMSDINPGYLSKNKTQNEAPDTKNEKDAFVKSFF
jgi:hypothetical protein